MRRNDRRPDESAREDRDRRAATAAGDLLGRTWVTRRGIQVDRIACAWLVRRFVDARARFRFLDTRESSPREGEISFDLPGGHFSHEGDRCTFETLMARAGPRDRALAEIAEVVHDIDLRTVNSAGPRRREWSSS